jgi:hypothetical protein
MSCRRPVVRVAAFLFRPRVRHADFSAKGQPSTREKVTAVCDFAA